MTDIYKAPIATTKKEVKKRVDDIKDKEIKEEGEIIILRQSYLLLFFRLGLILVLLFFLYIVYALFALLLSKFGVFINPTTNSTILFISIAVFLLVALVIYIKWKNTYYTIKMESLDLTTGLFETVTRTLRLDTFAGITIEQGVLGKILNYGTIVLTYQAKEQSTEPLTFFPNPEHYGEIIKDRIKKV